MLKKLTKKQEEMIQKVRQYWLDLSWKHQDLSWQELIPYYSWLYTLCKTKNQSPLVICLDSPLELQVGINMINNMLENKPINFKNKPWERVKSKLLKQLQEQNAKINSIDLVKTLQNAQINQTSSPSTVYFNCWESDLSSDSCWVAFYDYFTQIGLINHNLFNKYKTFLKKGVWMSVLTENVVFVCPAPKKVYRRPDGVVHNENGKAYDFGYDEEYCYVLNGVSVPKWFITKPLHEVTRQDIMGIKNVDQRREFIRKIGIDVFISKMGAKSLDKKGDYELLTIDLSNDIKDCRYLKMKNPSIGTWHVEGVSRECKTVQQAINWRAGDINQDWIPTQLT